MKEFNNFETEYCLSLVHDLISLEHKTPSPFMKFCSWKRHDVYMKLPNVTFTDMSKILGLMWNNLSADEKAVSVIVIMLTFTTLNDVPVGIRIFSKRCSDLLKRRRTDH